MINLIPNEDKKKMSLDFYLRLVTLIFLMLGFSFLIGFVAILPSYFLTYIQKNVINTKLESQKNQPISQPDQDTLTIVDDLKNKLNLIEKVEENELIISQKVINEVIFNKISGIEITEISYQNNQTQGEKINVSGRASSRETLLAFRRALEDNVAFSEVDLPISNFVKGSNIEFYLSLIPS